jgi:patatin-like phospholipase/acyl hydrolase
MDEQQKAGEPYRFQILSLDGGGIRGAFVAGFLAGLEERIGRRIGPHFDLIAGTSTGGIIAAALAFGEPAARIEQFYLERGPAIFSRWWERPRACLLGRMLRSVSRSPARLLDWALLRRFNLDHHWLWNTKYEGAQLKDALTEVFGDKTIGEAKTRLLIPAVNVKTGQPKVFKTRHLPHVFTDGNFRVVDVVLATAAAPTYFPHSVIERGSAYVDGGLWANNPAMVAIVEAMMIQDRCAKDVDPASALNCTHMLSIGTGNSTLFADPPNTEAGIFWWVSNGLMEMASSAQSQGVNFQARHVLGERHERVDFDIPGADWSIDNARLVESMVHIGRQKAVAMVERYQSTFFARPATAFMPFQDQPPVATPVTG